MKTTTADISSSLSAVGRLGDFGFITAFENIFLPCDASIPKDREITRDEMSLLYLSR
jgi:hypothetical protein